MTAPVPVSSVTGSRATGSRPGRSLGLGGPASGLRARRVTAACILAALLAGTALRLVLLARSPAWQWDECVYYEVAVNVQHGMLGEHQPLGTPWQPFLYQPPFYLLLLARWFALTGASIYHARVLGVVLTAAMLGVLSRLLWKLHGPRIALFAVVPVIFDGWLSYIERVSYIENALILLIVVALLLYQRALERPGWARFALAGLAVGAAADFKQTGTYLILAVLLCWLITGRAHRGHFVLLGVALAAVAAYIIAMTRMYDVPGHDWYVDQSLVQVRRVLGLQGSGGTLTTPGGLAHLLAAQYRYFVPSALAALAALTVAARRLLQCYRMRDWRPARDNALLFSWLAAGVVVFGVSALKFPQYFALILLPAYCFGWTEVARWDWSRAGQAAAAAAAAAVGVTMLALALAAFSTSTLAQTQRYAAARIPAGAVVVTERSIGDLIRQPWCPVQDAVPCLDRASYAITWRTYLQSSFQHGDAAFARLMRGAQRVRSLRGAVGTATIWKLRQPS
jgi:4-amino-4-deoxy-L-arabinose transferase-like glycosyltransferase